MDKNYKGNRKLLPSHVPQPVKSTELCITIMYKPTANCYTYVA